MKGEKERGENCVSKNTAVVWDRARYLIVCLNILATTSEIIVDPLNQVIWGICGSKFVEQPLTWQYIKCIAKIKEHGFEAFVTLIKV